MASLRQHTICCGPRAVRYNANHLIRFYQFVSHCIGRKISYTTERSQRLVPQRVSRQRAMDISVSKAAAPDTSQIIRDAATLSPASTPAGSRIIANLCIERRGAAVAIIIDRPTKLNAFDSGMIEAFSSAIPSIARDPQVYAVLLKSNSAKAFSAGGDLRELYAAAVSEPPSALASLAREYALVWLLDCFSKPTAALINGAVMGTGCGLSMCCTHRVAGAGYQLQMPETAIGFFPDVGMAKVFAGLPHRIGIYLGLTGVAIGRADAHWLGLATHCIDQRLFGEIEQGLAAAEPIDALLDDRHEPPGAAPLATLADVIERCFSASSVPEILARLAAERTHRDWCDEVVATLVSRPPLALEVTLRHIRQARDLDLRQTLAIDYRIAARLIARPDFLNAVRALVIDKGPAPRWQPASLPDVNAHAVAGILAPMPGAELILPTRQEMQAARV